MIKNLLMISSLLLMIGCTSGRVGEDDVSKHREGKIVKLSEASGICYVSKTDTLFAVTDTGKVYQLDKEGKILTKHDFSELSHHDFEGITYDEQEDIFYIAIESVDNLLSINREFQIQKDINIARKDDQNRKIFVKDNEHGIEGVTMVNGTLFVVNQSYDMLPKKDPSVLVKLLLVDDYAEIEEVLTLENIVDMSGLAYHEGNIYVISDKNGLLLKYDVDKKEIVKTIPLKNISPSLKKISIEGVAFDNEGNIYFAHDDKKTGAIYKFPFTY